MILGIKEWYLLQFLVHKANMIDTYFSCLRLDLRFGVVAKACWSFDVQLAVL